MMDQLLHPLKMARLFIVTDPTPTAKYARTGSLAMKRRATSPPIPECIMASRGSTSRISMASASRIFGCGGAPRIGQNRGDLLEQPLALSSRKFRESRNVSPVGDGLRKDAEEVAVSRDQLVFRHGFSLVL